MSLTKRKNRVHISIIACLIVCIAFFGGMSISAYAADRTFYFNVPEEVVVSQQFECVLNAARGFNIKALQLEIEYDPDAVKFKKADFLQSAKTEMSDKNGKLAMIVLFEDAMTDGDICKLYFNALSKEADSEIKLIIKEAVDESYNDVPVEEKFAVSFSTIKRNSSTDVKSSTASRVSSSVISRSIINGSARSVSSFQDSASKAERKIVSEKSDNSIENEFTANTGSVSKESIDHSIKVKNNERFDERKKDQSVLIIGIVFLVIASFVLYREKSDRSVVIDEEDDSNGGKFLF